MVSRSLSSPSIRFLREVDCKDQFNNIDPVDIASHLSAASNWLSHRRIWRTKKLIWSVHRECKRLDRAGTGNSLKFRYLSHDEMTDTIMFEINHNNYIRAAGGLWSRSRCILTGGYFSAQAAELHSLWSVYKGRHKFRALGELQISGEGFPY